MGKPIATERRLLIILPLNFIVAVRSGLKDDLAMITPEALMELRTFVLQTVLHKV